MPLAIYKRAGGRRRYNKERQQAAGERRRRIVETMLVYDFFPGWQSWLGEVLGVHRGTISRDIDQIVTGYQDNGFKGLGPRSNAKVQLLDELTIRVEQAKQRRLILKDVRESRKARGVWQASAKKPTVKQPVPEPPQTSANNQAAPAHSVRAHPFPHSIPRQQSRFDRMRCFPR